MNKFIMALFALCLFLGAAVESQAHSRAGLEKVILQQEVPTEDGIAYYLEAYVAEQRDENGTANRFFLWNFDKIEMEGNKAHIHVTIQDQKTTKKNPDVLYLTRNSDNSWSHVDADGKVIEAQIYTMIEPPTFTLVHQIGAALLIIGLIAILIAIRRVKKKSKKSA